MAVVHPEGFHFRLTTLRGAEKGDGGRAGGADGTDEAAAGADGGADFPGVGRDDFRGLVLEQGREGEGFIGGGVIQIIGGLEGGAAVGEEAAERRPVAALEGIADAAGEAAHGVVEAGHGAEIERARPRAGGPDGRQRESETAAQAGAAGEPVEHDGFQLECAGFAGAEDGWRGRGGGRFPVRDGFGEDDELLRHLVGREGWEVVGVAILPGVEFLHGEPGGAVLLI